MANNFQLIDKVTDLPTSLSKIDEDICKLVLNCKPDDKRYGGDVFNWFDTIGFMLSSGMTLEDGENSVREHYKHSDIWKEEFPIIDKIISYLQSKYTAKHWVTISKQ
jgi:hypothetical protein